MNNKEDWREPEKALSEVLMTLDADVYWVEADGVKINPLMNGDFTVPIAKLMAEREQRAREEERRDMEESLKLYCSEAGITLDFDRFWPL